MEISNLKYLGVLILFHCLPNTLAAQSDNSTFLLGLNPSVTVEPFYERGEFDVNVLPIVFQKKILAQVDVRLTSILNLGLRNSGNQISHYGLEIATPIFFTGRKQHYSQGFFMAPILALSQNRLEDHRNVGVWIEPGYQFLIDERFSLSIGIQVGGTHFNYPTKENNWGSHFGVNIILGRWF